MLLRIRARTRTTEAVVVTGAPGAAPAPLAARPLFAAPNLRNLAFSPDGRWLLVVWGHADQFVFLRPFEDARTVRAVQGVRRRFGGTPLVAGWCCSAAPSG